MLNHITLMGRLTRDPELRYTQTQLPVASFSIACERDFGGKDGGEKQTDFIDIVAWRHTAEFVSKWFTKGQLVAVSGRLQLRDWTDREGNKRRSAEVVADNVYFGESKRSREENAGGNYGGSGGAYSGGSYGGESGGGYANNAGGNSYRNFDETSGASAFSELSDSDGELPF